MNGRERRLQLLIGRRQVDGQECDQQNPQGAVEHKGRAGIAEEQPDAEHDTGHGNRRCRKEAKRARAGDDAAGRDIGNHQREDGADRRGRGAQNDRVLQRELGRGQFGEHEDDIMKCKTGRRHKRGGIRRERGVEQREIRQEHRVQQHHQAERQCGPSPALHLDAARRAILAADDRKTAAAEDEFLRLQQQDGEQQQRHCGGRGQFEFGRILEQAPDLRRHGVETCRQRQDSGRTEQRHRLQEGNQRTRDEGRERQRNGDAPRRGPRLAAEDGGCILQLTRHVVERIGDQHKHEGKSVAGDHKDDPGERIDVEEMLAGILAGHEPIELVEQPTVRRRQQFPRHRAKERRRHERRRHQRADELSAGHVGARYQPADRRRDDAADGR